MSKDRLTSLMGCAGRLCEGCDDVRTCPINIAYEVLREGAKGKKKVEEMINVQPGTFGKQCGILGKHIDCSRAPKFMIFGYDGKSKLSRLEGNVCAIHLPLAVRRVKAQQRKKAEERK